MSFLYEFIFAPASEAFEKDQAYIRPAIEVLKVQKVRVIYAGIQTEKPQVFLVVGWNSVEDHKAFSTSGAYANFIAALAPSLASDAVLTSKLVYFPSDIVVALTAPVTELLYTKPKDGHSQASVSETMAAITEVTASAVTEGICTGGSDGKAVNADDVILVLGWDSVEHQNEFIKRPSNWEVVKNIGPKADINMMHSIFTTY
ncbi:hypothetical protein OF83DRAFT_1171538 [Amylostereum chailletii]|nr:hypothetical protein OF83DRAFT_1171538 [Amylostereum chailletii]